MKALLTTAIFLFAETALGCPFCDTGGFQTALFILLLLGLFSVSMFVFMLAFIKSGAFKSCHQIEMRVLTAEHISTDE